MIKNMFRIYAFCFLIFSAISGIAQKKEMSNTKTDSKMEDLILPEWAKDANIYEVNIRQYTPEGTFLAFKKHLPRLRETGVEILWFMPIFPISDTRKKGSLGSYYAVSDFRKVNPAFGTMEDFKSVIEEAHKLGMKVILDWVPNHTGWDHIWIKSNPDFYTRNAQGEIIDPLNEHGNSMGWTDVADLNYSNKSLWNTMKEDMLYWINSHQIDGFRHDMAMLVPLEFWKTIVPELLKVKPDLFMLAESEERAHIHENCFHAMYSWSLFHTLNDIAKGHKNARDLDQWINANLKVMEKGNYMLFITNHDENSWAGSEIERMGDGYKTFAVLTHTLPGIPLMYSGQEEPLVKRLQFFEKDDIGFEKYSNASFYQQLNTIKKEYPALWNMPYGGELDKVSDHDQVYAFVRSRDKSKVSVILNLSPEKQIFTPLEKLGGVSVFNQNQRIEFPKNQPVELKPWEYIVLIQTAK